MVKRKPSRKAATANEDSGDGLETYKRRAAARADADSELLKEIEASLAQVGMTFADLPNAKKLEALAGYKAVQVIENFPELEAGNIGNYIRAVNRAMLDGAIPANTGKILLYGTQLYISAEPDKEPASTLELESTRAICAEIDASSKDKRHKKGPAK